MADETTPTTETPEESAPGTFEDLSAEEAIAFDFFGDGEKEPPKEEEEKEKPDESETEKTEPTPKDGTKTEEPPTAEPVAPPTPSPEVEALRQENARFRQELAAVQAAVAQQKAPKATDETPRVFNIGVPDEIVDAMTSEDPRVRKNAVAALINGTADILYKRISSEFQSYVPRAASEVVQKHTDEAEQRNTVYKDFYGKYPEYEKPELRVVVLSVANAVAQEMGASSWTPGLRDAVAARLKMIFPPASPPPTAPVQKKGTPRTLGPTTRPGGKMSQEDLIAETLGL